MFDKLIEEMSCDVYLFAHTHQPFNLQYKGKHFINSGAVCCSSHGKAIAAYGILTLDGAKINYDQREYHYDFEAIKKYYLQSEYHKKCPECSNLYIYML